MFNKKFSKIPTDKQVIGEIGEDLVCEELRNRGYTILERNYLRKWGELDIIAKFKNILHFVEVKTITTYSDVIRETGDDYRAEDNMHPWKLKRLNRAVQTYLMDRNIDDNMEWQFDLATVYLDKDKRLLKLEFLEDIVL